MKVIETKKNLISSFLFLVFGALIFAYPNQVVKTASIIVGIIVIAFGIFLVIKNYYETKSDSNTSSMTMIFGIIAIILGILFVVLASQISQILQYILGAWILFTGIERLIIALSLGKDNNSFITQLVIALLLLAAGLYTILKAHIEIQIVGLVMIVYAILEIIGYVTNKKDAINEPLRRDEKEEVEETKKITSKEVEKTETKETKENIKEAKIVEEKPKKEKKTKKKTK